LLRSEPHAIAKTFLETPKNDGRTATPGCIRCAQAGPLKLVTARASGQIVSQVFCGATEVCQEVHVTGTATVLGRFTGVLTEVVDITDGTYAGTGVFTMSDGSTITTAFAGQVTPPDENGRSLFAESHQIVGGTGKYATASGNLEVVGMGDAQLNIQIVGVGTLSR
jgi:hypothetical protein